MRFVPNPALAAQLAATPRFKLALAEAAQPAADAARNAMQAGSDPRRGHIRDRIKVVQVDGGTRIAIDDPFGHLVEWGSANNPPYAPLRRGVRAAGLRLRENDR